MQAEFDSKEQLNENLSNCDKEPIHQIGFVQAHGYLIAVTKTDYIIQYVSENCQELFQEKDLVGQSISVFDKKIETPVKGDTFTELLNVQLRGNNFSSHNPYKVTIRDTKLNIISSEHEDMIILSLEPQGSDDMPMKNQMILGEIILKLNLANDDFESLMQVAATQLRNLLNLDRVMIYKFWEDWHGEVIAEARKEDITPFLGLHYPATDIPKQARALYKKNLIRLISDVHSTPVPILSAKEEPLDLSQVPIRAVSPIHIEYLKNMGGVSASYSISLLHKGELWGLIACHHSEPIFLNYDQRKSSEIISQYLSNLIELKSREESEKAQTQYDSTIERLESHMREDWDVIKGLTAHKTNFLDITEAIGGAICFDEELVLVGETPTETEVRHIMRWLSSQNFRGKLFQTTNLSQFFPESSGYSQKASGLLALTISEELHEHIIWFKPEQLVNVTWAGKNNKDISKDKDGNIRISPRKSFESWSQQVRNTSEAWSEAEINSATRLLKKVHSLLQLKSNEIRRLNEKLNQAYEELDSFSYTLSHDLKTPLTTIKGYLELFMEEHKDIASTDPFLAKMSSNADLMQEMISSILQYSKISREEITLEKVNVKSLINQVAAQMKVNRRESTIDIQVPKDTLVWGNKTMIYQIFLNLIDNAIKYTDSSITPHVIISASEREEEVEFSIKDNGIGIPEVARDKIFGLFSRVPSKTEVEGTGVGLAIVKRTVEKQKGRIWVESREGDGSTFRLSLKKFV